ncbi:ERF family protein [Limnospira sp. PMC 289.06]|uniref:ERF family protein n=1 Tax=Limnospira sp. PMC 289.06 TaxID=2981094 RepID=UPI0028E17B33|nr:ERF family protein [Limnospira sp. PMC 289.06]
MNIYAKLLKARQAITGIQKNGKNKHRNYQYSTIDDINAGVVPALAEQGLIVVSQVTIRGEENPIQVLLTEIIDTETGEKISSEFIIGGLETKVSLLETVYTENGEKNTRHVYHSGLEAKAQDIGAAITYARRYNLTSLLNLSSEEDLDHDTNKPPFSRLKNQPAKPPATKPAAKPPESPNGNKPTINPSGNDQVTNWIKESDRLINYLEWDIETARNFLKKHFRKAGRSQLNEAEWVRFIELLRAEAVKPAADDDYLTSAAYGIEE